MGVGELLLTRHHWSTTLKSPEKAERLRNRFFCKFYYYAGQTGLGNTSACTGCGRCIDVCPAGVDITEVLLDLGKPA